MEARFSEPVRIAAQAGRADVRELRTAAEALRAIHRDGLGDFQVESPLWHQAADKLMAAERVGSGEAVEDARRALLKLLAHTARSG